MSSLREKYVRHTEHPNVVYVDFSQVSERMPVSPAELPDDTERLFAYRDALERVYTWAASQLDQPLQNDVCYFLGDVIHQIDSSASSCSQNGLSIYALHANVETYFKERGLPLDPSLF